MKKIFCVLISVLLLLSFASCGGSQKSDKTASEKRTCADHNYTSSVAKEASYDSAGEMLFVCESCGHTYTQVIEQLTKPTVPNETLDKALSDMRYDISQQFSIPMGQLINYSIDGYKLQYYSVDEALSLGYLFEDDLPETADKDMVYIAVVSGNTKVNPEIPYMTEYEDQALVAYMEFDENNNLIDYGYDACSNLRNCALIMFSSSF